MCQKADLSVVRGITDKVIIKSMLSFLRKYFVFDLNVSCCSLIWYFFSFFLFFFSFFSIIKVIDIGSGKGYLSSFLSMQYNLKVYGIDSSKTNTNGAHERNRKLKKHWKTYQSRARVNSETQRLEKPIKNEVKCKAINEKPLSNNSSLQSQDQGTTQDLVPSCVFTEVAVSETSKQTEINLAQAQSDESKLSEEALAILSVLPADAVEFFSSSHCNYGEVREEEKARRKMAFMKAKESKSSESSLYFPLTSYISAETELSDIITDLEVTSLIFEIYFPSSLYCCFRTSVMCDVCTYVNEYSDPASLH